MTQPMPQSLDQDQIHQREADFHDQWAMDTPLEKILVREAFEAPTAPENRCILKIMGDLRGKRLLDIGCGLGETSVYFALKGAQVTASDISPEMVERAKSLAKHHNTSVEGVVAAGEDLPVPRGHFDIVFTANTIHHVPNKPQFFGMMRDTLKPGGLFCSWDPLAYNPVINVYRKMASGVRTEDETPLTFADVSLAGEYFENVQHREFWISTLSLFLKYYAIDRVHPNADRYWKRILRETNKSLWWWQPLRLADCLLTRIPLVKRLAWNMVMWGHRKQD